MSQHHQDAVPLSFVKGTPLSTWISLAMAILSALGYFYTHMAEIDKTAKDQLEMRQDIRDIRGNLERMDSKMGEVSGKIDAILEQRKKK